jgi:hypothetical protein
VVDASAGITVKMAPIPVDKSELPVTITVPAIPIKTLPEK